MPIPTPQEQIEFLRKFQRLLTDGLFVASYKFALLRALADLSVQKGDDSGDELELSITSISEIFVELYWRQTRPFVGLGMPNGQVLRQNTGKQAAIVNRIADEQNHFAGSLPTCRSHASEWNKLLKEVGGVISTMPLWKLQRVGDEMVDFLYPNVGSGDTIRLRAGVPYCLRNFYGIVRNLIEGAWSEFVRCQNATLLGHVSDISQFLFGAERSCLDTYRPILRQIQKGDCFYCGSSIGQAGEVDHFVPWSRYPVDLGHNFVLAHKACNGRKRDYLAGERHLERWIERNETHRKTLEDYFQQQRLPYRYPSTLSITRWAYSQTSQSGGLVWIESELLQHLGGDWERLIPQG